MQHLTTFANYHLLEVVSSDAASTLYRATADGRDAGGGGRARSVALLVSNVLDSDVDRRQAQVFQRKARAAMDVNHAGVARVVDAGAADGRVYAATAWRDSVTLGELIAAGWLRTPDQAVEVLELVARGLDAAHEAGLVHGAVGTRTIRIDTSDATGRLSAFVSGFGIDALLLGPVGSRRYRDAGPVPDDLLYASPEQLRGGMTEPATDQYALACALYHCVTGQPPFARPTAAALFGAHLFSRPQDTGALAADGNQALRAALATGMSKRPEDRHASCTRLLTATRGQPGADTRLDLAVAEADGGAVVDGPVRAAAGDASDGPRLAIAGDRIATVARSGWTSARTRLEQLPAPVLPLLALLAGMLVALLLVVVLSDTDGSPTASEDPAVTAVRAAPPGTIDRATPS